MLVVGGTAGPCSRSELGMSWAFARLQLLNQGSPLLNPYKHSLSNTKTYVLGQRTSAGCAITIRQPQRLADSQPIAAKAGLVIYPGTILWFTADGS